MPTKGEIATRQKGVTVDAVWTVDVSDFTTRTALGREELCSPKFDVTASNLPPTRWYLKLQMNASDDVGLFLFADEDQLKHAKHRAHFSFSVGDGSDQLALIDEQSPHIFSRDPLDDWGWRKLTTRTRLFTQHLKDGKITIKASITVCSDQSEDFTRDLHAQKLIKLFKAQKLTNFTISCEGKEIVVCKELMEMGSPVLAAMLDTDMKEAKESKLTIADFKYSVIEAMFEFLSTGEVSKDADTAELLKIADKYQVNILKVVCVDRMMAKLTLENACQCFHLADLCQLKELKDAAASLISANYEDAQETEGWKSFIDGDFNLMKELWAMGAKKQKMMDNNGKK